MCLRKDGGSGTGENSVASEVWMTGKVSHHEVQCAAKRSGRPRARGVWHGTGQLLRRAIPHKRR